MSALKEVTPFAVKVVRVLKPQLEAVVIYNIHFRFTRDLYKITYLIWHLLELIHCLLLFKSHTLDKTRAVHAINISPISLSIIIAGNVFIHILFIFIVILYLYFYTCT